MILSIQWKKGQMSIFVIVAIILAAVIGIAAVAWQLFGSKGGGSVSNQAFEYYEECVALETRAALTLAGTQGGYIKTPTFIPGSDYAPFSSQLDFLGFPVPYWQYISGNGIIKENVPKKQDIENELAQHIESTIQRCDFSIFEDRGVNVTMGLSKVDIKINEDIVEVHINQNIVVSDSEGSSRRTTHNIKVPSRFGALYRQALSIYQYEQKTSFLENYSSDVLYLYAPVDGVETSCAPKIWKTRDVVSKLHEGLAANVAAVKMKGDYYTLQNSQNKYFVVDHDVEDHVNFLYSTKWPSRTEISGASQEVMIAEPVGLQQGLGVLGFCYTPYHFVYDFSYPVMVQLSREDELFQFPLVVTVDNNLPRQASPQSIVEEKEQEDICAFASQPVSVNVRDVLLKPIDGAQVTYACFDQICQIGKSTEGRIEGMIPGCLNGYLSVSAKGYASQRQIFSSVDSQESTIILDRLYPLNLDVKVIGAANTHGLILISFEGPGATSVVYPEVQNVSLSEGAYNITVYVYGNATVTIPASTSRECTTIPRSGFVGLFGGTHEQCYDINLPETKVDTALVGGGSVSAYLLPAELEKGTLEIRVPALPKPSTLAQLQTNYESFALQRAEVVFT